MDSMTSKLRLSFTAGDALCFSSKVTMATSPMRAAMCRHVVPSCRVLTDTSAPSPSSSSTMGMLPDLTADSSGVALLRLGWLMASSLLVAFESRSLASSTFPDAAAKLKGSEPSLNRWLGLAPLSMSICAVARWPPTQEIRRGDAPSSSTASMNVSEGTDFLRIRWSSRRCKICALPDMAERCSAVRPLKTVFSTKSVGGSF
mmetsp:Transcript_38328/g.96421  ORF Transcript_38328/g.96421 Transcript_38328/m.96421 type:complete len:202 (+) Transcript_38328:300-905(+)